MRIQKGDPVRIKEPHSRSGETGKVIDVLRANSLMRRRAIVAITGSPYDVTVDLLLLEVQR